MCGKYIHRTLDTDPNKNMEFYQTISISLIKAKIKALSDLRISCFYRFHVFQSVWGGSTDK